MERDPEVIAAWSFYLTGDGENACRLVVRLAKQVRRRRSWGKRLIGFFLGDPLDLVMEQRMLRTIRRLAERDSTPAVP